ncbi:MAG: T9SS type A sorting domain-containing protein [Bacteroidota bacterium]|nr:T9SS type A sorting domain-containing protein [Bacteroidota bacterium]
MLTKTSQNASACFALTLCLLLCGAQKAHAQQEIRYPQLLEHDGKRFAAYVNEINGTATWIIDTDSLDFTLGSSLNLTTESEVETKADAFIDAHKDVFGLDTRLLGEPWILTNGTIWFIRYPQLYKNYRVWMAELVVSVLYDGTLVAVSASVFPQVEVNTTPSLSSSAALQAAFGAAGLLDLKGRVKTDLVIVPVELEASYTYGLAWEVSVYDYDRDPPFSKTFLIDAHSGKVLEEYGHGAGVMETAADSPAFTSAGRTVLAPFAKAFEPRRFPFMENAAVSVTDACSSTPTSGAHGIEGTITLNTSATPNDVTQEEFVESFGVPFPHAKFSVASSDATSFNCTGYADGNGNYAAYFSNAGTYTVTFEIATERVLLSSAGEVSDCASSQSFTMAVDGTETLDWDWGWGADGKAGASAIGLNGVYFADAMYRYLSGTLGASILDNRTSFIKVLSRRTAYTRTGERPSLPGETERRGSTIELGYIYGKSSEILLHEYVHDLLYARHGKSAESNEDDYGAIAEAIPDFLAADYTSHSVFGGPAPHDDDDVTKSDSNIVWRKLNQTCVWMGDCSMHKLRIELDKYEHSMAISGALWAIRGGIAARASKLLISSLLATDTGNYRRVGDVRRALAAMAKTEGEDAVIETAFVARQLDGSNMPTGIGTSCKAGAVRVAWNDNSGVESGYVVEQKATDSWTRVTKLGENTSGPAMSYTISDLACTGLTTANPARFRVAAFKAFGTDTLWTYSVETQYPPKAPGSSQSKRSTVYLSAQAEGEDLTVAEPSTATELIGAYPNPFNPSTAIDYSLHRKSHVRLMVYDMLGRRVAVLEDAVRPEGRYSARFDASQLPSGTYVLRMETPQIAFTRILTLLK